MKLRNLEMRDAGRMLGWMHDRSVVEKLQTDFASRTIDDCRHFIEHSQDEGNLHLAIVDENDLYMGTVSLKHITDRTAEFAITVCREAMGKGYSIRGMNEMLRLGFDRLHLTEIYWCVAQDNLRARRFYDKNHFPRVDADRICITGGYTEEQIHDYVWYQVSR